MEFKINLPNPWEMSIPQFFAQMRIALKAAEKSYQEMIKGEKEEDVEQIMYLNFRLNDLLIEQLTKDGYDCTEENWQKLALSINKSK